MLSDIQNLDEKFFLAKLGKGTVTPKTLSILILNMMHEAQHLIAWESHLALVGI